LPSISPLPAALGRVGQDDRLAIGRLDLDGAELELGDLAEQVDLVDGQQVRGRLAGSGTG
jgi:hypothetical protein